MITSGSKDEGGACNHGRKAVGFEISVQVQNWQADEGEGELQSVDLQSVESVNTGSGVLVIDV